MIIPSRAEQKAYAQGAALDHLGALMGVARIPAQAARCELRFALAEALDFDVPIPAVVRVASGLLPGQITRLVDPLPYVQLIP